MSEKFIDVVIWVRYKDSEIERTTFTSFPEEKLDEYVKMCSDKLNDALDVRKYKIGRYDRLVHGHKTFNDDLLDPLNLMRKLLHDHGVGP